MEPTPVPPDQGGDDDVSGLQQGLRLSDAEGIAAQRLEGAAEGSLKEALAIARAEDADKAGPQPADAIGATGTSFAAGPLVRRIEAGFAEIGNLQICEPLVAFSPMPRPPVLDVGIALIALADTTPPPAPAVPEIADIIEPASPPPEDCPDPIDDALAAPVAEPLPEPQAASTLSPDAQPPPSIQPLTSALDAAARLAADASVAAEALENLKRLLEHKQQLESRLPQLAGGAALAPASDNADAPVPPPLPPLPLPLHAEPDDADETPRAMLPAPRPQRMPRERRGLDVRGFMAGFALSWAFGVVLYLFMTAG